MNLIIVCKKKEETIHHFLQKFKNDKCLIIEKNNEFKITFDNKTIFTSEYEKVLHIISHFIFKYKTISHLITFDDAVEELGNHIRRDFNIKTGIQKFQLDYLTDKRFKEKKIQLYDNIPKYFIDGLIDSNSNIMFYSINLEKKYYIDSKYYQYFNDFIKAIGVCNTFFRFGFNLESNDIKINTYSFSLHKPFLLDILNYVNSIDGYEILYNSLKNLNQSYQINPMICYVNEDGIEASLVSNRTYEQKNYEFYLIKEL